MGRPSPRLADEKKRSYVEEANSEESDAEASGASSGEAEAEEDDSASDYSEEQPQPKRRGRPPGASSSSAPKAKAAPRKSTGGSGPGEDLSLQAAIAASLRSVACGGCSSETCAATAGGAAPAGGADPSFRPTPKNHTGTYCVQYASTGRAKCITCGENIEKNSLRPGSRSTRAAASSCAGSTSSARVCRRPFASSRLRTPPRFRGSPRC